MNNFTPRAQQVLALARKEADRFNHNYVGTEHLLLGLIREGEGMAIHDLRIDPACASGDHQFGRGVHADHLGAGQCQFGAQHAVATAEVEDLDRHLLAVGQGVGGTLADALAVAPGDRFEARISGLGPVRVRFGWQEQQP